MADGYKYAKSHEWAKVDGDVATVGISDHAQVRSDMCSVLLPILQHAHAVISLDPSVSDALHAADSTSHAPD